MSKLKELNNLEKIVCRLEFQNGNIPNIELGKNIEDSLENLQTKLENMYLKKVFKPFEIELLENVDVNGLYIKEKGSRFKIDNIYYLDRSLFTFSTGNHNEQCSISKSKLKEIDNENGKTFNEFYLKYFKNE